MKEKNFEAGANKNGTVQQYKKTKQWLVYFANALLFKLPLVAPRNHQLREPAKPYNN